MGTTAEENGEGGSGEIVRRVEEHSRDAFAAVTLSQGPSLLGTLVGLTIDGSAGALLVAPVTAMVAMFLGRMLGKPEELRATAALEAAALKLQELEHLGYERRRDDFFDAKAGSTSDFFEVAEGVLSAAVEDQEQRKAPLLGRLLANIAQGKDAAGINRADANALVGLVRRLSYRQLCLVALIGQADQRDDGMKFRFYPGPLGKSPKYARSWTPAFTLEELVELETLRLVVMSPGVPADQASIVTPVGLSIALFEQADLWSIPEDDLREVRQSLQASP